jgi:hypothetical protein
MMPRLGHHHTTCSYTLDLAKPDKRLTHWRPAAQLKDYRTPKTCFKAGLYMPLLFYALLQQAGFICEQPVESAPGPPALMR